jgi:hypothetical protein
MVRSTPIIGLNALDVGYGIMKRSGGAQKLAT